ncbi:beta-1,3-galactosyltransferase 1-like [Pecten maximus]|uniref:beta-1,3-galactosyltransferase 1-like n=1 Tax=Pecten maximus TaxID=6579 RepID=UPI001457E7D5|nr:beta-1,3-galactosyltransferase 1-like [Pecten maximus]
MRWKGKMAVLLVVVVSLYFSITVLFKTTANPPTHSDLRRFTSSTVSRNIPSFLIHPQQKCFKECVNDTVILVLSKASHRLRRRDIRQTWGNLEMQKKYNLCLNFLVGIDENVSLSIENDDYGDIIQVDIEESYYNLTDKTIAAFRWMAQFCSEARFFFKVDDDVFVNIANLQAIQLKYNKLLDDEHILGACSHFDLPWRTASKWHVSFEQYPFETYPPFCFGPGYLMTSHTACRIYEEMLHTTIFKLEDVYVGMVAYRIGIHVHNVENFLRDFRLNPLTGWIWKHFYMQCTVVLHYVTPAQIQELWNERHEHRCNIEQCSIWRKASCIFRVYRL